MWRMWKVCPSVIPEVNPWLSIPLCCTSDHLVQDQIVPTGLPRIPGHEIVGTVAAVPASETVYKVGDRVGAGWHGGHCFQCDMCLEGHFSQCRKQTVNGGPIPFLITAMEPSNTDHFSFRYTPRRRVCRIRQFEKGMSLLCS